MIAGISILYAKYLRFLIKKTRTRLAHFGRYWLYRKQRICLELDSLKHMDKCTNRLLQKQNLRKRIFLSQKLIIYASIGAGIRKEPSWRDVTNSQITLTQ